MKILLTFWSRILLQHKWDVIVFVFPTRIDPVRYLRCRDRCKSICQITLGILMHFSNFIGYSIRRFCNVGRQTRVMVWVDHAKVSLCGTATSRTLAEERRLRPNVFQDPLGSPRGLRRPSSAVRCRGTPRREMGPVSVFLEDDVVGHRGPSEGRTLCHTRVASAISVGDVLEANF